MLVKQNVYVRLVLPAIASVCLIGCSSNPQPTAPIFHATPPLDPWVITNLDPKVETPALLWNGLIGIRTHAFSADVFKGFDIRSYEQTGEEKILPLENPIDGYWALLGSDQPIGTSGLKGFKETLSLKDGVITRSWVWDIESSEVNVRQSIFIDPAKRRISVRWTLESSQYIDLTLRLPHLAQASKQGGLENVQVLNLKQGAIEYQIGAEIEGNHRRSVPGADEAATWQQDYAIVGIEPGKPLDVWLVAQDSSEPDIIHAGIKTVASQIQRESENFWRSNWQTDIEIDGPVEDQQFIRSALFYLRSSIHPEGKMSVSPMGLSSDIYNGHIFWDADIWVYPALALIDPGRANAIPRYRLNHLSQATRNGIDWLKANRPTGINPMGSIEKDIVDIAKFPWESSVSGKETVPGPSKFQDHISGSVAWTATLANTLGLDDPRLAELQRKVKNFYLFRSQKNPEGLFEIKGTMSPDEHHTGDNDLYTNLLAMWSTNGGKWPNLTTYKLPKDDKSLLTYDNDPVRGYKQAAAVLSIYPLQYAPAEKQARQMMDRFADKVTKNGPAMTDSIHSIIWSRLGEKDKAYKAWHESWKPFVKPPFLLFSEKRNSSRTYFTTGAAGSLQAVLFGFAGLRIDNKKAPNAQWSMPLKNGQILSIAPNLPREWKKLTLKNLTILGKKHTFEIVGDKVKVTTTK